MPGTVRVVREGKLGWIVFDHPERRNAITVEMWRSIPEAVRALDADDDVRVILMRGAGQEAFVSGADISEFESRRTADAAREYDRLTHEAFDGLLGARKPLLAMIRGFCIGGGAALALCADIRYASADARFGVPPARLGIGYHSAGVERLANLVGPQFAAELILRGEHVSAEDALQIGLVNRLFSIDEIEAAVTKIASRIAENAPLSLHSAKLHLRQLERPPHQRDVAAMNASIAACFDSEDYAEGVRAFLEKRPPKFRGR